MSETTLQADRLFSVTAPGEAKPGAFASISKLVTTSEASSLAVRDTLVSSASEIEQVTAQSSANLCTTKLREIKAMLETVETGRVNTKAPSLKLCKDIDQQAKDFSAPLLLEQTRLKNMLDRFTTLEFQKAEAEQRRKDEEARKLQQQMESATSDEEADEISRQQSKVMSGVAPAPIRVADTQARNKPKFDVVDPVALYAARPDLCHAPTPNLVAINKAINEGLKEVAGLANIRIEKNVIV